MIVKAKNIKVSFKKEKQNHIFGVDRQSVLRDVSLTLNKGECLGIIGESGSGKTTLGRVLCGILKPDSGQVLIDEVSLYEKARFFYKDKQRIGVVFQDYSTSVNPHFTVKRILEEALIILKKSKQDLKTGIEDTVNLLEQVGLDSSYLERYPHELSGGQLQRVCIARAIALKPKFIIFDEAISSLDMSTQKQIMDLLINLRKVFELTYIFITHDLTAITYMCNRVIFLYQGEVIEEVDKIEQIGSVKSEYSKRLLASII